jgi:pyrroloquinoline quinone biosynthesis protein D
MSLSKDAVPRKVPGAEGARFGADYVILDPAGRMLRGLNETGTAVWELVDGVRTVEDIARHLATRFGAPSEQVLSEVRAFLGELEQRGLIALSP